MTTESILNQIDDEIARLQQARDLLAQSTTTPLKKFAAKKTTPLTTAGPKKVTTAAPKKRTLSPEARARIAAAQKKRWAAQQKALE